MPVLDPGEERPPVAVVLPGGGARGAYEVGALSVLLPQLEQRGERVSIFCGTSVGAINATVFASLAHLPAGEVAEAGLRHWREMRKDDVIRPVVGPALPLVLSRMAADVLGIPYGSELPSILDASPLRSSLERWMDWLALHRNVRDGTVKATCVVATSLARSGPVAFVETAGRVPKAKANDDITFVRATLDGEHVRASAAIPFLFPPVEVTTPRSARDFYIDGGTRLNSPLKPALRLGAQRIIVVGFEPFAERPQLPPAPQRPRLADVAGNVLEGLLYDQISADLLRLAAVNSFFQDSSSAASYRRARGDQPYKEVSYALVAPRRRGELGRIAERVYQERYTGLFNIARRPDYPLMAKFLGGKGRSRGELLSFLLFDDLYTELLIAQGREDAKRWLRRHPDFWCSDAAHDFGLATPDITEEFEADAAAPPRQARRARR